MSDQLLETAIHSSPEDWTVLVATDDGLEAQHLLRPDLRLSVLITDGAARLRILSDGIEIDDELGTLVNGDVVLPTPIDCTVTPWQVTIRRLIQELWGGSSLRYDSALDQSGMVES